MQPSPLVRARSLSSWRNLAKAIPASLLFLTSPAPLPAATLTANVGTRPNMALFKPGEVVPLIFGASGAAGQTLTVTIRDVQGAQVFSNQYTVSGANWTGTVSGYNSKLGFYRVHGQLSDGTTISPQGSRAPLPAGTPSFATYAIVPDPALRPALSEDRAFFGMQGGFLSTVGTDIFAFLGVRWYPDEAWTWNALSPVRTQPLTHAANPAARNTWATNGAGGGWTIYTLPNLTKNGRPYGGNPDVYKPGTFAYNTGALNPDYYADWDGFATHVAQNWAAVHPARTQRYYEVTWEPIVPWGYNGSAADLVIMYQRAAAAMKAADASAKIAGPCVGVGSMAGLNGNGAIFDAGLASHIDVFSAHPYMEQDLVLSTDSLTDPELAGQPSLLATMKRRLKSYKGSEIPMIGTEQGYRTRQNVARELDQARRLVRANLLVLGEKWKINTAFFFSDYPTTDELNGVSYWDWGFFYNLDTASYGGYAPGKVSPKPVAAAYAAMTYLVENRKAVRAVNWLADTTRGYVYESHSDPNDLVMALWDYAGTRTVTLNSGTTSVDVYDWMGNKSTLTTANGDITVTVSPEPVYIKGIAPAKWGSNPNRINIAANRPVTTSGDALAATPGSRAVDGDCWSFESRWVSVSDMAAPKWIEVDLGGTYAVDGARFWTGEYLEGYRSNFYKDALPSYKIQYWNGGAWVDVVSRSNNTRAAVDEPFPAVNTSKIRLIVGPWAVNQIRLYELEVFTTSSGGLVSGQYYRLKNRHNNLYLAGISGQNYDGGGVGLWNWSDAGLKLWQVVSLGNGTYSLRNQSSLLYLAAHGSQNYDGGAAGVWNWYGSPTQCWHLEEAGGGYYRLRNQGHSALFLSAVGGQTWEGSAVGLWNWYNSDTQYWTIDQP
jgi:hypothetical protein